MVSWWAASRRPRLTQLLLAASSPPLLAPQPQPVSHVFLVMFTRDLFAADVFSVLPRVSLLHAVAFYKSPLIHL